QVVGCDLPQNLTVFSVVFGAHQRHHVLALKVELIGVLDGDHPVARVDFFCEGSQQGGFASTRPSSDQDVGSSPYRSFEQHTHLGVHDALLHHLFESDGRPGLSANHKDRHAAGGGVRHLEVDGSVQVPNEGGFDAVDLRVVTGRVVRI